MKAREGKTVLKGALRIAHTKKISRDDLQDNKRYEGAKLIGDKLDLLKVSHCHFDNFLFADNGMRGVFFEHCTFSNCIFSGCYLKDSKFVSCKIVGCHFEICTTTGMSLDHTSIEHTEFFRCVIPHRELIKSLSFKYSSNDTMMLNCATEAHRIGRWREAESFLARHVIEKRKFWWAMLFSKDSYYHRYGLWDKGRAVIRLLASYLMSLAFGDRAAISRIVLLGLVLLFVISPTIIFMLDMKSPAENGFAGGWLRSNVSYLVNNYYSYLMKGFNLMIGSNVQSSEYQPTIENPDRFEVASRVVGIIYTAIVGNIATKSIGFGPKW